MNTLDVDIDVLSSLDRAHYGIRGIIYDAETKCISPHPSAVYFFDSGMTIDEETGFSAIDYERASQLGFSKVDLLTNTSYNIFANKQELLQTLLLEPDWSKLKDPEYIKRLPQINQQVNLVLQIKPTSIDMLADLLALMRPAKSSLLVQYLLYPEEVRKILYTKPKTDEPYFKKSHAYAYASMLICYMNKLDSAHLVVL